MKTFILCAGKSERFGDVNKHFLLIDNEPLIKRTLKQLPTLPYIVCKDIAYSTLNARIIAPNNSQTTCDTLLSTEEYWEYRNVILLGDVYYTDGAIKTIFEAKENFTIFSDGQDIFALSFTKDAVPFIVGALKKAIATKHNNGRLWEMYRALYGINSFPMKQGDTHSNIVYINDKTQDFDEPIEYSNFVIGKTKNIVHEQENRNT